jgi:hypothetical protein
MLLLLNIHHLRNIGVIIMIDTWHQFATLSCNDVFQDDGSSAEAQIRCIHDQLYVYCSYLPGHSIVCVYNEMDNKWIQLDAKLHPRQLLDCYIPLPLPSSKQSSSLSSTMVNNCTNNNAEKNIYMTVLQSNYGYERYDIRHQQLEPLKLLFPSWLRPQLIPSIIGKYDNDNNNTNNKWLIWPTRHALPSGKKTQKYTQIALIHVNDIHKGKKKWRWWPALPSSARHLGVSGYDGSDDRFHVMP